MIGFGEWLIENKYEKYDSNLFGIVYCNGESVFTIEQLVEKYLNRDVISNELTPDTILKEGDIVENKFGKIMVLGVCGKIYLMSSLNNFEISDPYGAFTIKDLINRQYKLIK